MKALLLALALGWCTAAPAFAQLPVVENGALEPRRVNGPLAREFESLARGADGPMWVGYAVATRGRDDGWECGNAGGIRRAVPTTVRLEGPTELYVLYRVAERRIGEVRLASPRCTIDVGGLTLRWLTGVTASDSLDWLAALAQDDRGRRIESQAMTALALHGDDRVVERLVALARDGRSRGVRSSALFWLSQRAGDQAVGPISDAIERDPDTEVKRQAVFALSRLPREQGVPRLIDVARNNRNPQVRQQAMFWLGQSQDARALAFFEDVLRSR